MSVACPVCTKEINDSDITPVSGQDSTCFNCSFCGRFILSRTLQTTLPAILQSDPEASIKISHAIYQMGRNNKYPSLTTDTIKKIIALPLPRPREQADLLIRWLAENLPSPGETIWIEPDKHGAVIGAKTDQGFELIVNHLFEIGLVRGDQSNSMGSFGRAHATLSFDGWEYYENLKLGGAVYRKAFMAMKFGDPILDEIFKENFKPNVKKAGFDLIKLDEYPKAGLIDDRMRVEIQKADFVVADLSHDNHGAYWEAGYAEGMGKPVIYTCEKNKFNETKTHFDTNHHLTIVWDAEKPEEAGEALKSTIRATLPQLAKIED